MAFDEEQITFFAQTDSRGAQIPFGIKAKDRTRHVYVIGKTGMGKSTLLENMAVQDIKNGNGLAFIDPHGQTAEKLLDFIPESRKDDVLYFAPFDTDNPVAFNVMEDVDADRRHLVVSGLMSVFKKIWVDAWSARMEYILSNTLLALLEYPGSTLLGVNRMLSDKTYRKKVIDNITDPSVKSFWVDEFLKYNERYMQEAGDAIKNKVGQFTSNPLIRNIVGQPKSSFDIRDIMDKKKILIMNLSKGLVGETNANLLGSMLTTRIYLAAMSRADLNQEALREAPQFYFYVDEFQSFANATFANILSEARKYKLNLTIAHQYIEQMEEEVRNAVFGNVGTTIVFRVGPFDAEVLETVFSPKFLAPDIVNLGFAQIYLTLMIDGIGSQPFSATTLGPISPAHISYKDVVINRSREQFSSPRKEVERAIYLWHGLEDPTVPKKPKETIVSDVTTKSPIVNSEEKPKVNVASGVVTVPAVAAIPKEEYKQEERKQEERKYEERKPYEGDASRQKKSAETKVRDGVSKEKSSQNKKPLDKFKNNSGSRYNETDTKTAPSVSNTKNLDELRAILKNLTAAPEEKKTPQKDVAPLSLQVATVVQTENVPKVTSVQEKPVVIPAMNDESVVATKEHFRESESKTVLLRKEDSPVVNADNTNDTVTKLHTPTVATPTQTTEQADDPLSPKKLERMMRVTGGDKTPFA